MTTYEKIKALLELGTLKGVEVENEEGIRILFIGVTSDKSLLSSEGGTYPKDEIESLAGDKITPIPQEPKVLESGTKIMNTRPQNLDDCVWQITGYDKHTHCYEMRREYAGHVWTQSLPVWQAIPLHLCEEIGYKSEKEVVPVFEEEEDKGVCMEKVDKLSLYQHYEAIMELQERVKKLENNQ